MSSTGFDCVEKSLEELPRLDTKAMGPCAVCKRQLLATGMPFFFRIHAQQCGLDHQEIRRHVGLANAMGGGEAGLVLAGVLGPAVQPVIVMDDVPTFNVCYECSLGAGFDPPISMMDAIGHRVEQRMAEQKAAEEAGSETT